jgi:hypothetical protein
MPDNKFLPFALDVGASVIGDDTYDSLPARLTGFQVGIAEPTELNKVWRQCAAMVSMLGDFIVAQASVDALDDGDLATLLAHFTTAVATAGGGGGGGGPPTWLDKTANYTASAGDLIVADTSGGPFTITLPASPTTLVSAIRIKGNFSANNLTIAGNGHNFNFGVLGAAATYTLNADVLDITILFVGTQWFAN